MTRMDEEAEVGELMTERASLARFGLELPPDRLMLLRRLLYRLGWTRMKLRRHNLIQRLARKVGVPPQPQDPDHSLVHQVVGAVMDHPSQETLHAANDVLQEHFPDDPAVQAFHKWVHGGDWRESGLLNAINPRTSGSFYSMTGPVENEDAPANQFEPNLLQEIRPVGKSHNDFSDNPVLTTPFFGRNTGDQHWHLRRWAGRNYPLWTRPFTRTKKPNYTSAEVAKVIHDRDGPKGLVHMLIGSWHWRPEKTVDAEGRLVRGPREGSPHINNSRKGEKPRQYAKIDGHVKAHPLVAGFPIETALRHLANDPANHPDIRNLAKVAVTGGDNGDGGNVSMALWALHDSLHEHKHPAKDWYNWMSAGDKVHLDAHVQRAAREHAERERYFDPAGSNLSELNNWQQTPEHFLYRAHGALEGYSGAGVGSEANERALNFIKSRTKELMPTAQDKDIDESIRRGYVRSVNNWHHINNLGSTYENPDAAWHATSPIKKDPSKNMKAVRYHRLFQRLRYALGEGKPSKSLTGEDMFTHGYSGGVARIIPRNEGQTLHVDYVGPEDASPGQGDQINTMGSGKMRTLLRSLKAKYPNSKFITGLRGGRRVVKSLDRMSRVRKLLKRFARDPLSDHIKTVEKAVLDNPNSPELVHTLADLYEQRGDHDDAARLRMTNFNNPLTARQHADYPIYLTQTVLRNEGWDRPGTVINNHDIRYPASYSDNLVRRLENIRKAGSSIRIHHGHLDTGKDWLEERDVAGRIGVASGLTPHAMLIHPQSHYGSPLPDSVVRIRDKHDNDIYRHPNYHHGVVEIREHPTPVGPDGLTHGVLIDGKGQANFSNERKAQMYVKRLGLTDPANAKPRKMGRTGSLRRYKMVAGNFIDALRRIRSSQQQAVRGTTEQIAAKLGLKPASTVDAIHDSPGYSVPGVAQAIYSNASPEAVHAAAAWYGLTGNIPGMAVFHYRPDGPDFLYRFRATGSGHDLRARMDKAGITSRILVPFRTGFDVLIPDKGGALKQTVENFTKQQKTELQASRGHFNTIGSADQARAREMFRDTITKQEQSPVRKAEGEAPPSQPQGPPVGPGPGADLPTEPVYRASRLRDMLVRVNRS